MGGDDNGVIRELAEYDHRFRATPFGRIRTELVRYRSSLEASRSRQKRECQPALGSAVDAPPPPSLRNGSFLSPPKGGDLGFWSLDPLCPASRVPPACSARLQIPPDYRSR